MAKYHVFCEVDISRTPNDPKAKKAQWLGFQESVTKQIKDGIIKDWGLFAGETNGYLIFEGNVIGLHTLTTSWVPFVKFTIKEVMTIDEVIKATKALPE